MQFQKPDTYKLQRSLTRDIALVVVALVALVITSISIAREQSKKERQEHYNRYVYQTLEHVAKHFLRDMAFELERIRADELFLKEFQNANREALHKHIEPQLKRLREKHPELEFLHVHQADGLSFLRMHHPEKYGDAIAKLRPMLQDIHKNHQLIDGFETGIFANVYRVITPIFDKEGVYIGALEAGLSPDFLINTIRRITTMEGLYFVKENMQKLYDDPRLKEHFAIDGFRLQGKLTPTQEYFANFLQSRTALTHNEHLLIEKKEYITHLITLKSFDGSVSIKLLFFEELLEPNPFVGAVQFLIYFGIFLLILFALWLIRARICTYEEQIEKLFREKVALIEEIKAQNELLMLQSRHAQMGEMMSMIAHQWRQPLGVISMGVNNLLVDVELEAFEQVAFSEELEEINKQVEHLSLTIDEFRNFFREDKKRDLLAPSEVFEHAQSIIQKSLETSNIEIHKHFEPVPKLAMFGRELEHVFINLLKNAQEAMIKSKHDTNRIDVSLYQDVENVIVEICDSGDGIDEEILDKIFEPYFSTKDEKNGTGLGLYMSKMIIEKHFYGVLSVKSSQNGSCFKIEIPKKEPKIVEVEDE